jgi:hypothetical protein
MGIFMKKYWASAGLAVSLISANVAWAGSSSVEIQNSKVCPAQLEEFKQALKTDPSLVKLLSGSSLGLPTVLILDPKVKVEAGQASSAFGGMDTWELSPSLDADNKCVPVKAAEIIESIHRGTQPIPVVFGGFLNCTHEVGEVLDASRMRPDLVGGLVSISRPLSDEALSHDLVAAGLTSTQGRVFPRVFPMMGSLEVVPGLDKKGRCVPVKSKMIVQILEEERKTIQDSAKNMGPAFQEKKPEASEMVLDSKVGSVKVFVGDTL